MPGELIDGQNTLNIFKQPTDEKLIDNTLSINGTWEIDGVPVTATAEDLNNAGGSGNPGGAPGSIQYNAGGGGFDGVGEYDSETNILTINGAAISSTGDLAAADGASVAVSDGNDSSYFHQTGNRLEVNTPDAAYTFPDAGEYGSVAILEAEQTAPILATQPEIDFQCSIEATSEEITVSGATLGNDKRISSLELPGAGSVVLNGTDSGQEGSIKVIQMTSDNGDVTMALTHVHGNLVGANTTATFSEAGQSMVLCGTDGDWVLLAYDGVVLS